MKEKQSSLAISIVMPIFVMDVLEWISLDFEGLNTVGCDVQLSYVKLSERWFDEYYLRCLFEMLK